MNITRFLLDGVPHAICQGCGTPSICTQQDSVPDAGSYLEISGWYGGFSDDMGEHPRLILCHDCTLKVYRAIPALAELRGLHPSVDDVACCEFHWTFDDGHVLHGDGTRRKIM